jgi:hypothetical protein
VADSAVDAAKVRRFLMNETRSTDNRPQVSLKWMLVGLVLGGAGIGLLGRTFFYDPQLFRVIIGTLSTLVVYLVSVVAWIKIGWVERRPGFVLWGILMIVLPLMGLGLLWTADQFTGSGPGKFGVLSTRQIIQQRLPQEYDEPWVWNELVQRLASGKMTRSEVDSAIHELAKQMVKAKPTGWDQPLSWQQTFVRDASTAGMISESAMFALCDAFFGAKPGIEPLPRLREGPNEGVPLKVDFGSPWATQSGLPVQLLWAIKAVTLDGEPVKLEGTPSSGERYYDRFSCDLDPGDHEVTVTVECAYVDSDKLLGLDARLLPMDRWPKARKRWQEEVSAQLTVVANDATLVQQTSDPKDDPMATRAIRIERFVVQPAGGDSRTVLAQIRFSDTLQNAISFDAVAIIDGQRVDLGPIWIINGPSSTIGNGGTLQATVEQLPSDVEYADLLLLPNPSHIEQRPEASRMWGKPIRFRNLTLERLDLEVGRSAVESAVPAESAP